MNFMMKRALGALLALCATQVLAGSGNLFHVTSGGAALGQTVSYTLCLTINGKNPLSCQNYSASNAILSIKTTAPHHTYHYAGIKINTPGFRYTGQGFRASTRKNIVNETAVQGYAFIGTVSDTQAATGTVSPTGGGATTALSVSITDLALSISGLTLNGNPSGQSRTITVTNTGDATATGLAIDYPTWPTGTVANDTCGTSLNAGTSCTITVTPHTTPTANCSTTGTAPTPGVITISAANTNVVTTNVVVLNYGCIYQGGYLFSMTETADAADSIGGKVVSQMDQAARAPDGVVWSSNGVDSAQANVSYDIIPGIDESSTATNQSPDYADFANMFGGNTYINQAPNPVLTFMSCVGKNDGQCNSSNILLFYNQYTTNYGINTLPYTATAGDTTNLTFYAAGRCTATISGYSDWYLPALCEMGPSVGIRCTAGTQNIVNQLPALVGNPTNNPDTSCVYGANCLAGYYWSSTEYSLFHQDSAWYEYFSTGGSTQSGIIKNQQFGVRCSRALTL